MGKAFTQAFFAIQPEQINSSAPLRGEADHLFAFVSEVLCPGLRPRVEQRAKLSGLRVEGREVASLMAVTAPAGERQIVDISCAPCFSAIT